MRRKTWRRTAAAATAWAGLAWGGPVEAAPPAAPPDESIITLREEGGVERKCVIQKSVPQSDGTYAHTIRDMKTGETMTIYDNRPGPSAATKTAPVPNAAAPKTDAATGSLMSRMVRKPSTATGSGTEPPLADSSLIDPLMNPRAGDVEQRAVKSGMFRAAESAMPQPARPESRGILNWFRRKPSEPAVPVVPSTSTRPVPVPMTVPPVPAAKPATLAPAVYTPAGVNYDEATAHWLRVLRESVGPSEREQAVMALAASGKGSSPEVVDGLLLAAQLDPAPSVRACAVRCLAGLNVRTPAYLATLQGLKSDRDQRVQAEVTSALARLGE